MRAPTAWVAGGIVCIVLTAGVPVKAETGLQLQTDTDVATAGFYQLSWDKGESGMRLVESRDPDFTTRVIVYDGADTARLVSGKPDGEYYYRLEASDTMVADGAMSNTLKVTVRHHSLRRAWTFFFVGAFVFAATLGLILFGSRAARETGR